MADDGELSINDVVVSKVDDGHELLAVTADPSDWLSLLYRGHEWSAPYAVARGAKLTGRKGGDLWYTTDMTTFDYLETFRRAPSGVPMGQPTGPRGQMPVH